MPVARHLICGYALNSGVLRAYAKEFGLPSGPAAATDIASRLQLSPRVRFLLGKDRNGKAFPCLAVATNRMSDHMPMRSPEQLQAVKDFLKTDADPKWYYKE
ncbi:hypothetical protein FA95DRAFT_1606469 [Auriscalpium vulgare]|uniref:Uncharacterized protein n=1 Tax=Auriscalpium vulgare TaxID=40419 RepID=A0ACB8RTD2_9AGAM|nr:hypothetical protein FA95DRAFT_1606469 [Auriscalpium vulgare]